MKRRDFIAGLGGAAALPFAARAQERVRRIGVLFPLAADDAQSQRRLTAFAVALQQLGWTDGRNLQLEVRWGAGDPERFRKYAAELVALQSDVILAAAAASMQALQPVAQTIPLVFVQVTDPVSAGFVASLARPGGNATGFTLYEYGLAAKWLELLKRAVPRLTRVAMLRDPVVPTGIGLLAAMQGVAPALGVELSPIAVNDPGLIDRDIAEFAKGPNGGLTLAPTGRSVIHRDLIVALAAKHRLPAIYPYRYFVTAGGLMSYGPDEIEQYRQAAGYIDRILKGEKPADLPVQAATRYELTVNLKTAKALGITMPQSLLSTADEVIE